LIESEKVEQVHDLSRFMCQLMFTNFNICDIIQDLHLLHFSILVRSWLIKILNNY